MEYQHEFLFFVTDLCAVPFASPREGGKFRYFFFSVKQFSAVGQYLGWGGYGFLPPHRNFSGKVNVKYTVT
jgi:hypothetical protein